MNNNLFPSKPRYSFAKQKADEFLVRIGANALPFNPLKHLMKMDVNVFTYQEIAKKKGLTVHEVCTLLQSTDGATLYKESINKYSVAFNANTCRGRINWTLAHELGHIVLQHFKLLESGNITDEIKEILDKEADAFAGEILSPVIVLFFKKHFNAQAIMDACGISYTAACIKANYLSKIPRYYFGRNSTEHKLLTQFGYVNDNSTA